MTAKVRVQSKGKPITGTLVRRTAPFSEGHVENGDLAERSIVAFSCPRMNRPASDPLHAAAVVLLGEPFDEGVMATLAAVGEGAKADRAWLYRYDARATRYWVTHEWCRDGIEACLPDIQGVPVNLIAWVQVPFSRGETVRIGDVEKIPRKAQALKEELRRERVRAAIGVPLFSGRKLTGVIGLDDVGQPREWSETDERYLRLAGELILAAERGRARNQDTPSAGHNAVAAGAEPGGVYLHASNTHVKTAFPDIVALEAAGDYTRVRLRDGRVFHELRSLREWEAVLPSDEFLRVHRRHIVNLGALQRLRRGGGGRWKIEVAGLSQPLAVGRQFQPVLKRTVALRG